VKKPLLILKPSIVNAIGPLLLRYSFHTLITIFIFWMIVKILKTSNIINSSFNTLLWIMIIILIRLILPITIKIILLSNTSYNFFQTHISKEFKLFTIKKQSIPYNQIVNISIDITIWDQICKAGDIILSTAENTEPDLKLKFIKEPEEIEIKVYNLINKNKTPKTQN